MKNLQGYVKLLECLIRWFRMPMSASFKIKSCFTITSKHGDALQRNELLQYDFTLYTSLRTKGLFKFLVPVPDTCQCGTVLVNFKIHQLVTNGELL